MKSDWKNGPNNCHLYPSAPSGNIYLIENAVIFTLLISRVNINMMCCYSNACCLLRFLIEQGCGTFFLSRAISIFSTPSEGRTNYWPLLKNTKITAHSFGLSFMLCKEKATSESSYLTMTRACTCTVVAWPPKQKDIDTRCVQMYLVSYPCEHDLSGGWT